MTDDRRVAVAMSGGVDSSVAAALMAEQGVEVFGVMMRLWSQGPTQMNRCCSPEDMARARTVAAQLDIPFYVLDVQDRFKHQIVDFFIEGYQQGLTPNPCMECNRHIRWDYLLRSALAMGATHLATGHYARVVQTKAGFQLLRATDAHKDQSYVLSVMRQGELAHAVFPLGDYTKDDARAKARSLDLPVADRPESQDLCFVGGADYRAFLETQGVRLPPPGPIVDRQGNHLGQHLGLAHYTIGQRKGIRVSAPYPLYVLEKDLAHNRLVVGQRQELGRDTFVAGRVNWIAGPQPEAPITAEVRVRYKAREVKGRVEPLPQSQARVHLTEPLPDITPGQSAVFYQKEICLGGGVILA
jgi:tRNA-specific 2-thiouridylase